VRWTRSIDLEAGTYRFDLIVDDGVRFWIDNVLCSTSAVGQQRDLFHRGDADAGQHAFASLCGIHGQCALAGRALSGWPHVDGDKGAQPHRPPTFTPTVTARRLSLRRRLTPPPTATAIDDSADEHAAGIMPTETPTATLAGP
jgi:hypothetical protein